MPAPQYQPDGRIAPRCWLPYALLLLGFPAGAPPASAAELALGLNEPPAAIGRALPGEFEVQEAVIVGWDHDDEAMQAVVLQIVAAVWKKLDVVMLVPHPEGQKAAERALGRLGLPDEAVRLVQTPFDSIWTRDYGPMVVVGPGGGELLDAEYGCGERAGDDTVPVALAPLFGMPTIRPPLTIDGGNLLSNGAGLLVTTHMLVERNADRGYGEQDVERLLKTYCGATEVVFLEPLIGEPTGHIDMFATFVSPNVVVVGEYGPNADPLNAGLLERNAQRLAAVDTPLGPLQVVRIPMPSAPRQDAWWTWTNVLYANGTLLMPLYPGIDPQGRAAAKRIYRQLLPGWRIVEIDCSRVIEWGGAVHCVTRNICRLPRQGRPGPLVRPAWRRATRPVWPADRPHVPRRPALGPRPS